MPRNYTPLGSEFIIITCAAVLSLVGSVAIRERGPDLAELGRAEAATTTTTTTTLPADFESTRCFETPGGERICTYIGPPTTIGPAPQGGGERGNPKRE